MEDRPGGGKFWATFLRATFREENCLEGQKQNPRRSDDSSISVRVYRNAVVGTSLEGWESRARFAAVCNRLQSVACMKTTLASRTGGRMHTWVGSPPLESGRVQVSPLGSWPWCHSRIFVTRNNRCR